MLCFLKNHPLIVLLALVLDLVAHSQARIAAAGVDSLEAVRAQSAPLIGFGDGVETENRQLKRFLRDNLYLHHRVYRMMTKARRVMRDLFDALNADPRLMPPQFHAEAEAGESRHGAAGRARAVADYIAGMTDRYALDEHERLFDPRRLK